MGLKTQSKSMTYLFDDDDFQDKAKQLHLFIQRFLRPGIRRYRINISPMDWAKNEEVFETFDGDIVRVEVEKYGNGHIRHLVFDRAELLKNLNIYLTDDETLQVIQDRRARFREEQRKKRFKDWSDEKLEAYRQTLKAQYLANFDQNGYIISTKMESALFKAEAQVIDEQRVRAGKFPWYNVDF